MLYERPNRILEVVGIAAGPDCVTQGKANTSCAGHSTIEVSDSIRSTKEVVAADNKQETEVHEHFVLKPVDETDGDKGTRRM